MATPPPAPAPEEPARLERQRQLIEELQTLVNHVPYGLMVLEPGGVVRHLNAEAARQLRLPRHLAQGRTLGSLLDEYLEPYWAKGDYDTGTQKTVRALAELLERYGVPMLEDAAGLDT